MPDKPDFLPVNEDDLKPAHRWHRPLQAPGVTQVDFEERIDFRRLHDYRLARVRAALAHSGLGALLSFDQHNIRYTTSTVIGEWARDKLTRYSLLSGNGEPYIWDFGSAARHHKLYAPWLREDHCRAGMLGMRGATGADVTLFKDAAREIKAILEEEGVAVMPGSSFGRQAEDFLRMSLTAPDAQLDEACRRIAALADRCLTKRELRA